jgi:hypothetical protein
MACCIVCTVSTFGTRANMIKVKLFQFELRRIVVTGRNSWKHYSNQFLGNWLCSLIVVTLVPIFSLTSQAILFSGNYLVTIDLVIAVNSSSEHYEAKLS